MKAEDEILVARCRKGEARAFEMLLTRYEKPIYNLALRMVAAEQDASDVAQTVFLKAYRNLGSYDPGRKFFSWLYRIAVNESLSFLDKKPPTDPLDDHWHAPDADPAESARDAELRRLVRGALMKLTPDYRSAIVLRHYLGCSYHEMSEVLEVPETTVKSRLFTARRLLKRELSGSGVVES